MKYETILKEKKSSKRDVFIITVVADSNDADYMTETTTIKKDDMTDEIIDLIKKLDAIEYVNHALGDVDEQGEAHGLTSDDLFSHISIPHTEWGVCHSLETFTVEYIDAEGKIFDVDFYETYEDEDEESEED